MKKIIFILILAIFSFEFTYSQSDVVFVNNGKYYHVYFPNGFSTINGCESITWTGHTVATQMCSGDYGDLLNDPTCALSVCADAKRALSGLANGVAYCGPNYGFVNNFNYTTQCGNTDNVTCAMRWWGGDRLVYLFAGFCGAQPHAIDQNGNDALLDVEFNDVSCN